MSHKAIIITGLALILIGNVFTGCTENTTMPPKTMAQPS
jgi:hypothetical protein